MTAPAPKYRYAYRITDRHGLVVRGNTKARTVAEVRGLLAVVHGVEAAERAEVTLVNVEAEQHE